MLIPNGNSNTFKSFTQQQQNKDISQTAKKHQFLCEIHAITTEYSWNNIISHLNPVSQSHLLRNTRISYTHTSLYTKRTNSITIENLVPSDPLNEAGHINPDYILLHQKHTFPPLPFFIPYSHTYTRLEKKLRIYTKKEKCGKNENLQPVAAWSGKGNRRT